MRDWLRRLVDILSNLERPQEKGCESESHKIVTCQSTLIRQSVHFLGVSATRFLQCVQFLRLAVCFAANSLKKSSKNLIRQTICRLYVAGQSKEQISRCSCPPSDAKGEVLSNAKKVDAPSALPDHLKLCQNQPKPIAKRNTSGKKTYGLLLLLFGGIGHGGLLQFLALQLGTLFKRGAL